MTTRASLSLTEPNEQWIQAQIDSKEFTSRSDVVNDLIRKAREIEGIREKLIAAEQSVTTHGWITASPQELLESFKRRAEADGEL